MKIFTIAGSSISMDLALATIGCESGIPDEEAPDGHGNFWPSVSIPVSGGD